MAVRQSLENFGLEKAGIHPLADLTAPSGDVQDDILGIQQPTIQPFNIKPLTLEFAP